MTASGGLGWPMVAVLAADLAALGLFLAMMLWVPGISRFLEELVVVALGLAVASLVQAAQAGKDRRGDALALGAMTVLMLLLATACWFLTQDLA